MNASTSGRTVTVGLPQLTNAGSADENLTRTVAAIRRAAAQGAQIVCTQELFLGPYFCQTHDHAQFALAESVPGPTTEALQAVAKELSLVIVASVFEKRSGGVYHNTAAVIDADGTYMGKYRKMHIPDDPQYHEKFYFTPGDLGFRVWHTRYATIGVLICWDQWYPEAARLTALQGAEILFYPTAIGWLPPEKEEYGERQAAAWETIQRGHAIANGCYVAAVNRVGTEPGPNGGLEFWGGSFVADPNGRILAKAGAAEETLVVPCDLSQVDVVRTHWPFLRDRRIDAYQGITERYLDQDTLTVDG
jgi:N-carbamoylputrescine amidase